MNEGGQRGPLCRVDEDAGINISKVFLFYNEFRLIETIVDRNVAHESYSRQKMMPSKSTVFPLKKYVGFVKAIVLSYSIHILATAFKQYLVQIFK